MSVEKFGHCDGFVTESFHDQEISPLSVASRMPNQSFEQSQSDEEDFVLSHDCEDDMKISSVTDANKMVFRKDESATDNLSGQPIIEPVGSKDESVGEELGDLCSPLTLRSPFPLISRNSLATVTSEYTYDDDSTADDNLCPICLCGYQSGDILIESKHCTHIFHKGTQEQVLILNEAKLYLIFNFLFVCCRMHFGVAREEGLLSRVS
jgi:hypothetical protein